MCISRRPWTIQERKYLLQNYEYETARTIAAHLGRTRWAIYCAAKRLNLSNERTRTDSTEHSDGDCIQKTMQVSKTVPKMQTALDRRRKRSPRMVQVA